MRSCQTRGLGGRHSGVGWDPPTSPPVGRCPVNTSFHTSGWLPPPIQTKLRLVWVAELVVVGPRRGRDPGPAAPGAAQLHFRHTCVSVVWIRQMETGLALYNDASGVQGVQT